MKGNAIARIILYSLILLLLLGVLIAGLAADRFAFITESKLDYISTDEIAMDAQEVSRLELAWAAGTITIQTGNTDQITISESGGSDKYPLDYSLDNGKLYIAYTDKPKVSFGDMPRKDLTITVPDNWICQGLEVDGAALEITIDGLTLLDFDIDGAANQITFNGILRELDCDGAACSLTLNCLEAPSKIDLDGASVEMTLLLPEGCGFLMDMSGLSCSFQSDLDYSRVDETYFYGDKSCKIEVDGLSCDITIN